VGSFGAPWLGRQSKLATGHRGCYRYCKRVCQRRTGDAAAVQFAPDVDRLRAGRWHLHGARGLLGSNRYLRYAIKPLIEVLRRIPAPAIVPPLILFLGVDGSLKIAVVAMACFFPVFINTLAGVEGIDDVLLQTARTLRTGRVRTLTRVVLPAPLPMIAAGLQIAIGIGLVVTVISDMIAGSSGLGYYIVQMQYAMKPEAMYAAIGPEIASRVASTFSRRVERFDGIMQLHRQRRGGICIGHDFDVDA
jgi:ABC-type proline/glycine betaine transport system permease subunit